MEEASRYLELRRAAAPRLALATFLCVISPIALILLGGLSEYTAHITENAAAGIGLSVLIVLVAAAVGIFLSTEDHLHKLISVFDFETTPYICHPNPKRIPEYSDYELLARVKEWSVAEEE